MWIVVVVVIVPIAVGAPTIGILIPPAVPVIPAVSAGFGEFMAPVFGLFAANTVMLDGFVKVVVGLADALLAVFIST